MGKQMTEMLKGTLEGIVLAILSGRPAYGYEITARLREMGFSDIAEGTVYALLVRIEQRGLVDVEKHPSEKGPPRKVYSLNVQGQAVSRGVLEDLALPRPHGSNNSTQERSNHGQLDQRSSLGRSSRRSSTGEYKARIEALPEPYGTAAQALHAVLHVLRGHHGRRDLDHDDG